MCARREYITSVKAANPIYWGFFILPRHEAFSIPGTTVPPALLLHLNTAVSMFLAISKLGNSLEYPTWKAHDANLGLGMNGTFQK